MTLRLRPRRLAMMTTTAVVAGLGVAALSLPAFGDPTPNPSSIAVTAPGSSTPATVAWTCSNADGIQGAWLVVVGGSPAKIEAGSSVPVPTEAVRYTATVPVDSDPVEVKAVCTYLDTQDISASYTIYPNVFDGSDWDPTSGDGIGVPDGFDSTATFTFAVQKDGATVNWIGTSTAASWTASESDGILSTAPDGGRQLTGNWLLPGSYQLAFLADGALLGSTPFTIDSVLPTLKYTSTFPGLDENSWDYGDTPSATVVFDTVSGFPAAPSGTVQLFDDDTEVGDPITLVEGEASLDLSELGAGTHELQVYYSSSDDYYKSGYFPASVIVVTVHAVEPEVDMTPTDIALGALAADFFAHLPESTDPVSGSLEIFNGTTSLGVWTVGATGTVSVTLALPAGDYEDGNYTFTPDDTNLSPVSYTISDFTVPKGTAVMELESSGSWAYGGDNKAVFSIVGVTGIDPSGDVALTVDGDPYGSAKAVADGVAEFDLSGLEPGTYSLKASYSDDSNYEDDVTAALLVIVKKSTPTLGPVSASGTAGGEITVTVPVDVDGVVKLLDGTTELGIADVVAGKATFSLYGLAKGSYSLKAVFTPDDDAHYDGKTAPVSLVVAAASPVTIAIGAPVTFSLQVAAPGKVGTAEVYEGSTMLQGVMVGSDGKVSFAFEPLSPGTHTLRVVSTVGGKSTEYTVTVVVDGIPPATGTTPTGGTDVELSISETSPNGEVTITSRGFDAGETVVFVLHSDPVVLGTAVANSGGVAVLHATIPAGTALGAHTVHAIGGTSGHWATAPLQVTSTGGSGGGLASTGAGEFMMPLSLALLLLLGGAALIYARGRHAR